MEDGVLSHPATIHLQHVIGAAALEKCCHLFGVPASAGRMQ